MLNEVIIVGAGPTGLLLAIELVLAGVRPIVLDRLAEPDLTIKAGGIGVVGAEALERRGMGQALDDEEKAVMATVMPQLKAAFGNDPKKHKRPGGHFSALFLVDRALQRDPERGLRFVQQQALERMLGARAAELGVEVRRGVTVEGFEQSAEGVLVQTTAGPLETKYLVGCDGGRSRIRKLAGFEFPGTAPTITGYQAIVEVDHPDRLALRWHRTTNGVFSSGPTPDRILTVEFNGPPADREAPITREEVEGAIRRVSGADVRILSLKMATRWTDNARQASTYRKGRVLLAGDAAHIHSPFGGQGLNLGLVDAANLGFKLALALKGPREELLDTYTAERHPVGARVLENTRAQVALMRPDAHTSALRDIVADMIRLPEGNRYIAEMLSGIEIRYDLGDTDPMVGKLAKNAPVGDTTLYALMQKGGGVLVTRNERSLPKNVQLARTKEGPEMLVRPDGCIAWTSDSTTPLDDALKRWF